MGSLKLLRGWSCDPAASECQITPIQQTSGWSVDTQNVTRYRGWSCDQPRRSAKSHQYNKPVGGQWTHKTSPDINDAVAMNDRHERVVDVFGAQTTFTRTVTDAGVAVTTDCDPPDILFLARKGDVGYWSGNGWVSDDRPNVVR